MPYIYISSYGENDKKGIYVANFEDNKLSLVQHYLTEDFPSYIIRKDNYLYASLKNASKNLNNGGMNAQMLQEKITNIETQYEDELMRHIALWNEIFTERIHKIIGKINVIRRVGGAYAMLISNPCFKSAIYAVYERLVDNFDDEELYCQSAYFLVRAVMRMHSNEIQNT